jgi:peroxiredoxin
MVATPSTMIPIGTKAPSFELLNVTDQKTIGIKQDESVGHLVAFVCNHCPFVIHLLEHFTKYFNQLEREEISVYLISSNNVEKYPADSPSKMRELSITNGFRFPYLYDENQSIAKGYKAACTPDFFLFDEELSLYYRGRYDESRPGNGLSVNGCDLKDAMDGLIRGDAPPELQYPSMGCNVKWKPGNEPDYFKS